MYCISNDYIIDLIKINLAIIGPNDKNSRKTSLADLNILCAYWYSICILSVAIVLNTKGIATRIGEVDGCNSKSSIDDF